MTLTEPKPQTSDTEWTNEPCCVDDCKGNPTERTQILYENQLAGIVYLCGPCLHVVGVGGSGMLLRMSTIVRNLMRGKRNEK